MTATADLVDPANHDGDDNAATTGSPAVLTYAQPTGKKSDDDRVATLRVVAETVGGADCTYTVSVALPDGFAASEAEDGTELDSVSKQMPPAVATPNTDRISTANGDVSIDTTTQRTPISSASRWP